MIYTAIPITTLKQSMGKDRWNQIETEIKREYGGKKIFIEFHNTGPQIRIGGPIGKNLGTVAQIEAWAKKRTNK